MCRSFHSSVYILTTILGIFLICSCNSREQDLNGHSAARRQLNHSAINLGSNRIETISVETLESIFKPQNIEIFGLGEAAHGSATLLNIKSQIFKYLVETHKCRALCYEFNYRESLKLNRYVVQGEGNLDSLIYDLYWIQANDEFKGLLEWMKNYNSGVSLDRKVQFIGIDCQLDMFRPENLKLEFEEQYPDLTTFVIDHLNNLKSLGKPTYRGMSDNTFENIAEEITKLKRACRLYFDTKSNFNSQDQEIILHLVDCMMTSHKFLFNAYNGKPTYRDRFMAENTIWVKESLLPEGSTIALWAHNSHVCVNNDYYNGASMGSYIKESLGENYLVCGTSFTKGKVIAVEEDSITGKDSPPHIIDIDTIPPIGSINKLLGLVEYDNFILPIKRLDKSEQLYNYLDTLRPFLGIGDFYRGNHILHYSEDRIVNLAQGYDIIIHLKNIYPLHLSGKWGSRCIICINIRIGLCHART